MKQSKKLALPTTTNAKPSSYRYPFLFSYYYCQDLNKEREEELFNDERISILIDSGGFSAKNSGIEINLEEYMEYISKWQHRFIGFMALDKVGNPKATADYLKVMLRNGLKPIPIHVLGDDEKRMDELFEISDWVALAGLRRPHRGAAPIEYIQAKHQWAKGRKVHWLGYARPPLLQTLRPFSCDSASWVASYMWGRAAIYLGGGKWIEMSYKEMVKGGMVKPELVNWFNKHKLPISLNEFKDKFYWNQTVKQGSDANKFAGALSQFSWLLFVKEFEERFGSKIFLAAIPTQLYMKVAMHMLDLQQQ